ncbi:hypothetical protein ABT079_22610, partial [Streptomyces sp. NPDC002763]
MISLDRGLFEPATASTDQEGQTPDAPDAADAPDSGSSTLAEPVVDGHGSLPDASGQSPDGGQLIGLDRSFFTRATGETTATAHPGDADHEDHGVHEGHTPPDHTEAGNPVWVRDNTRPDHGTSQTEPTSTSHDGETHSTTSTAPESGATTTTEAGGTDPGRPAPDDQPLTERTVDGEHLLGSDTQDGGWISQDGTVYVSGDGAVEHGLTAPDGAFLANGEVRTIDGAQVYGTRLDDGSFLSEDGTTMVTAGGAVEHGQSTSDGQFVTERTVDGQDLWGSDTQDGGWISQDGTVYVSGDGAVEHGLTAPDGA